VKQKPGYGQVANDRSVIRLALVVRKVCLALGMLGCRSALVRPWLARGVSRALPRVKEHADSVIVRS
jgi:hypothetical protein